MFEVQLLDAQGRLLADDDKWLRWGERVTFHGGDRPVLQAGMPKMLRLRTGICSPGPYLLGNYHFDQPAGLFLPEPLALIHADSKVSFEPLVFTISQQWLKILGFEGQR